MSVPFSPHFCHTCHCLSLWLLPSGCEVVSSQKGLILYFLNDSRCYTSFYVTVYLIGEMSIHIFSSFKIVFLLLKWKNSLYTFWIQVLIRYMLCKHCLSFVDCLPFMMKSFETPKFLILRKSIFPPCCSFCFWYHI